MWILIVTFCASYSGGIKCSSFVPPEYFLSKEECIFKKPVAQEGVFRALADLDGRPIMLKLQCENLGVGA